MLTPSFAIGIATALALAASLIDVSVASGRFAGDVRGNDSTIRLESGRVRGIVLLHTVEFRGVPYARPPTGTLRFAPPVAVGPWVDVRDATRFAATCPQGTAVNEDCLYLNITVPRELRAKLPVMVWLHGGGFSTGTPNTYDATEMVSQGNVIFVGVEFRINVFGLFALPQMEGSGSQMLLDQQAALRWIQRNIGAFGGDPKNVTLFGESGGGIGTCAQITSPSARDLFQKAILQSGSCSTSFEKNFVARGVPAGSYFSPIRAQEAKGWTLAQSVGCKSPDVKQTLSCLRQLPAAKIADAGAPFISAAFGTPKLPVDPQYALAGARMRSLPILTGFNEKEGVALVAGMQLLGNPVTASDYPRLVAEAFGKSASEVLAHYPLSNFSGRGDLAWAAVIADRMFACPQLHDATALAARSPIYLYRFADPKGVGLIPIPDGLPLGPSHSSELPLLFRLLDGPLNISTGKKIPRTAGQQKLSSEMIGYWTHFAWIGKPASSQSRAWPLFISKGVTSSKWLTTPGSPAPTQSAAVEHQCEFWQPLLNR